MAAATIPKKPNKRAGCPDPIDIHVGKRLRQRRNLIGMSQEQLGKASGLTFQQIQKYERGTNRMGASRLFQLARILDTEADYFFAEMPPEILTSRPSGLSDNPQAKLKGVPNNDNQILQRRETLELIRAYYRITDPKQRRAAYNLIKSMAEQPEE